MVYHLFFERIIKTNKKSGHTVKNDLKAHILTGISSTRFDEFSTAQIRGGWFLPRKTLIAY